MGPGFSVRTYGLEDVDHGSLLREICNPKEVLISGTNNETDDKNAVNNYY